MDYYKLFKTLGEPTRLKLVEILARGEECACVLLEEFEITQPTLSHHMKELTDCNLVNVRKSGKWNYYSLNTLALDELQDFFARLKIDADKKRSDCEDK